MTLDQPSPTKKIASGKNVPLRWHIGDVILDTYEVKDIYTSGGMAYVYRVHHRDWDIDLAIKSPKPKKGIFGGSVDLFVREAETWVNLGLYPHIVCCYYIRVFGEIPRIFMEFVDGGSLLEAIEQGSLYKGSLSEILRRILDIAIQFAWGLHFAHKKGLVHQDVKPANVMLTKDGIAKVTDFGMAQAKEVIETGGGKMDLMDAPRDGRSILVGMTGMTPAYCSPEQAERQQLSRRTDIWSWAVSILETFMGKKTWEDGTFVPVVMENYLENGPDDPGKPAIPPSLANLLRQCLKTDPEARPRDMAILVEDLKNIYLQEIGQPYPRSEPQVKTVLADTLNNRAVSMADLGRDQDAIQMFDDALQAESTHTSALYNRNLLLWRTAHLTDTDALEDLLDNQKNLPDDWEVDYLISLVHLERGDCDATTETIQRAVEKYGTREAFKRVYITAKRLEQKTGRFLKIFPGIENPVNSVAISSQGKFILSGGNDKTVRLWNVYTGECEKTMVGHTNVVKTVAITPDGKFGLSGGWDEDIRLWDLKSGKCLKVLEGHTELVQEVAFTPDGKRAISASSDCTLRLWDLQSGETISTLREHFDSVHAVTVSSDGRTAVSASFDNTLRIWDLQSGECLSKIDWVRSCTSNLALSMDDKRVLLAGGDKRLWWIDLKTGEPIRSFSGHTGAVKAVQIAPNGTWALSAGIDCTIRLWDLRTGRCLRTFTAHSSTVNSISISFEKVLAVSGSSDQTIRLWRLGVGGVAPYVTVLPRSAEEIIELSSQIEAQLKVARQKYSDGDYSGSMEQVAQVRSIPGYQQNPRLLKYWDQVGQKGVRSGLRSNWLSRSLISHLSRVNTIALSHDSQVALTGSDDTTLGLWDIEEGELIRQFQGHEDKVLSAAIATINNVALSGSGDGSVLLWRLATGKRLKVMSGHTSQVNSVAITHNGLVGLSGSNDNTLRLWDLRKGKSLRVLKGHTHFVRDVALTPDGRVGLSVGWDKTFRLWDLASGDCMNVFHGHSEVIDALAISPDGTLVVTGGLDHTLRFWDLKTGDTVRVIDRVHGRIQTLVFSTDGRYAFSGDINGTINIWEVKTGLRVNTIKGHASAVTAIAGSQNGSFLASVSTDRMLKIWRLDWDYIFPPQVGFDKTVSAYLAVFLTQHKPYGPEGIGQRGRPTWSQSDLRGLMQELSYRGYGLLSTHEVTAKLKQMARQSG